MSQKVWIFSDGACSGNPGPGGWAFVAGFFGAADEMSGEVIEGGGADPQTTNNRMEMLAAIQALALGRKKIQAGAALTIFTDSKLLIQGATQWMHGWKKKNWVKSDGAAVMNRDLWERLDAEIGACPVKVNWSYVPGHRGVAGNERVDEIAVGFSKLSPVALFEGPMTQYALREIFAAAPADAVPSGEFTRSKGAAPGGAASGGPKQVVYLSVVKGELQRHSTWAECERRVKGSAGAKFKKVSSSAEEETVLKQWGVKK